MKSTEEYFDEIYCRTGPAVYRYIAAKCYNIEDIRDLYQETFLDIYKYISENDTHIENEEAFAITSAKHRLAKHYTLLQKLKNTISIYALNTEKGEISDSFISDLWEHDDKNVTVEQAKDIIKSESLITQKILFLHINLQMSFKEISQKIGVNEKSVQRIYYKAIAKLRRQLTVSERKGDYDKQRTNCKNSI